MFVEFLNNPPKNWPQQLVAIGISWRESEPQPMADQIKLIDVEIPYGCELPKWVRRPFMLQDRHS